MDAPEKRVPATAEAYQILKAQIISMELLPGQLLMVQQLSRSMGISRTPVREAMVRLVEDGLVEPADGHKFRVTPITAKSLGDIYETRMALESLAVEHVARTRTPEEVKELADIIHQMEEALFRKEYQSFFEIDNRFHERLMEIHGNQMMVDCLHRVKDLQQRIRYFSASSVNRMRDTIIEHRFILRAIEAQRPNEARSAATTHLENVRRELSELLSSGHPLLQREGN